MSITRTYDTKKDCARLMVEDRFTCIDSTLITDCEEWWEAWEFRAEVEEPEEDGWSDGLGYVDAPMWSTWFEVSDGLLLDWIEGKRKEVAALGFTLIYRQAELWGLGIDGAGYDFYESHWIPLYDLLGLTWHE